MAAAASGRYARWVNNMPVLSVDTAPKIAVMASSVAGIA